ncbi:MAG: DUF4347 domain-containing protein, partial [Lentisphaeria bacterium]|nr:DUF4347 domain-containing protein [Lentisphaeria bacterium]
MGKKRNKVEIFKLEDRVLFEAGAVVQAAEAAAADQANNDAAGDGSAAAEMQSDNSQTASDELTPDNLAEMPVPPEMSGSDNADDTADADAADFAAADPESETVAFADAPIAVSETSERILVVLNSSVVEADSIVNDLGDNVEVLRLTSGTDALDTINDYLDEHADTKYSAIHLVSHGSEGYITLNGEKIDSTTINPADWKAIGEHLTDDADILVYGCDTAKSEEGKALVQTIANLTGADVAASIDSTGAAGDWDLEYRSGLIEAATINPVSYQHDLAAVTITVTTLDDVEDAADGVTSLREALNQYNTATVPTDFTILFDDSLLTDGKATITLTKALSVKNSTLGSTVSLTIDGDVDGDGTADITLDANKKDRAMTIGTPNSTVNLNGLRMINGSVVNGGAISTQGANFYLNVSNSIFEDNWAGNAGGAIANESTGAGIYYTITDTVFRNNTAKNQGGGAISYGSAQVTGGYFIGKGLTFVGNTSTWGGAFWGQVNGEITIRITESLFDSNVATVMGGAIYMNSYWHATPAYAEFVDLTVINNSAEFSGGAIIASNKVDTLIANSTIVGNKLTGNYDLDYQDDNSAQSFGGAGIFVGATNQGDTGGLSRKVTLLHNIIVDNTTFKGETSDIYSGNISNGGQIYSFGNIYGVMSSDATPTTKVAPFNVIAVDGKTYDVTGVTGADLFDLSAVQNAEGKYVADANFQIPLKAISDSTLNDAVNLNDYRLGSYDVNAYKIYCFSVDDGKTWYDYSGTAVTSPMTEYYLTDMVNGARYPYSSAGSAQYAPALMWSENADGTIAGAWNTVDGVIAELSSSTGGEYYFAATDVDYGAASVTVNSNLILRGSADTSGMNLTFVADGGSIRIDGMKFSGSITVATGVDCDITITDALITGGGTISSADLINIVNTTIYDFSGTISATGSMNLVNSTVYGSTGAISGDASAFRILNSIVVDSANVSGYTAKYSVFDLAGSGDTNTYSATAAGIFGTDLNWDGLMLAPVALLPADTNAAMNGAYVAMNGTNLYYSTNKADWFNFDGTAATDDVSAYILALDGAGQKRMVVGGKAVAGAYSSLSEGVSLTVTTAADVVDRYDGYISLREAWLNAYNGTAEYNYDTNGDSAPDGYRITFDANAIRSVTDPVYAMPASPDGTIRIVFGQDDPNYAASFVMNSPAANITIDGADALGNDQKIALDLATGTATRHFHVISGKLTLENLTVRGTGSDTAGNLDLDNARDIIFEKERGGNAIWSIGGTTTIRNVDFERFVFSGVANSWNGILHNRMNGHLIVEDSTFTDNKTDASVLIFSADSSINQSFVTFRNVTIGENNTAATWLIKATGIPVGNFLIENLTVDGATAGAVINTAYQGGYTLNGLTVINSKLGNALSISYNSAALVVDDVLIRDNTFSSHIIDHTITDNVKTVFSNMEIYNNTMTGTNSAVIRFSGNRSSTLFNTVIAGNTGATYGVHLSRQTASLFNNIILGATTDIYAVTAESIGTLNAAGNVYGTALIETGVTLNGVVLTESATGPGADNVVSTQADVFGDQALSTYWDGNTLAIQSDGKAARSGVLVGKIGEVFYYAKNGVWHNADGSVYQVDDGTGTMKDVALTTDAATGYGLGATATVYSTAKNVDTNGNPIDRLYALKEEGSEIFQSGTYAFNYIPVSAEIPALTVSTDQDVENMYDGVISLREALKYAQEDAAALKAGTITVSAFAGNGFDAATGTYTIKFIDTVLQIDLDSTLGTLVLANNALGTYSLTIDGAIASGKVVVDGGDKYDGTTVTEHSGVRIMSIGSGNTVTLQNLTLQKGFVSGGNGGAILNSGSLTLQSVSLLNNANMSDTAITWGGAVYNSGTLVVEDSLFSGNATYKKNSAFAHGAAISNKGTLTISGTTFEGNISAQDAGAIYNENGKLTITGSEFLNNKAASNGSAIYVLNGSLDVSDSVFSGNTGNNVIYNGGKPVTIDSSVFTGNGGTVLVNFTGT